MTPSARAILLCAGLAAAGCLYAQTGTGVIRGTVTDATGAVIPNAKLTLTNQATGLSRETQSSSVGIFYFGALPPGPYVLAAEASGFKRWSGSLTLEVGQTAVANPMLEVGTVEAVIEVTGAAAPITTESMELADVKDAVRIEQLPLNGRFISNLFNLTPGVEGGGNPRVHGMKVGSVEMLLDGISLVDRFGGGISRVQPGLDTVQEFRIETAGSNAQYSRPATVILVTKSGTNELHGSLFETHRNNAGGLRARQRQEGSKPAKLVRNEFGVSAGGPVYLGNWYDGRNRSFWFFAYEGLRQRTRAYYEDRVPTPEMWRGDFSQIIDAAGQRTTIFDPWTTNERGVRTPFPGNVIPANRIHPIYKVMESVTHPPTLPVNPFQGLNLRQYYPVLQNIDNLTLKGDHRFSDKDTLSGRFTRARDYRKQLGARFGAPRLDIPDAFGTFRQDARIYNATVRHTRLFTPTLFNELLLAGHRSPKDSGTLADFTDWPAKLGFPNPFGITGWPTLGAGWFWWNSDNRKPEMLTAYVVEDNLSWVRGRHTFKLGGKVRFEYNNIAELQQAQGSHQFGADWTAQYNPAGDDFVSFTGDGLASMALGLPTYLSAQYNRGYFYFEQKEFALYFQDTWKVTQRLTLDLGLRWDKWTVWNEKLNRLVNVDLNNFANRFEVVTPKDVAMESIRGVPPSVLASWKARGLSWRTARQAGLPDNLLPADNNNFGPRLGVAYKMTGRTVLRGSFGLYYWTMPLSQVLQSSRINPPFNLRFENLISSHDGTATFAVRNAPRPEFQLGNARIDTQGVVALPVSARPMVPWDYRDWRDNEARVWHFTLERELPGTTALRLSYVGDQGRNLEQRFALNSREAEYNWIARTGQLPPGNRDLMRVNKDWSFGQAINHTGYFNSHSLQAEVERRYSNGFGFQWFYVFTRALTTSDAGGFVAGDGSINSTNAVFQVPENIQLLGGGNLSYDRRLRLGYQNNTNVPAHRIRWNGIWDLPFGRGQRLASNVSPVLNHLIGGWQLATIGEWSSGYWMGVSSGRYLFGDPTLKASERLVMDIFGRKQRLWFRGDFDPRQATNVDQQKLQQLVPVDRGQRVLRPVGAAFDNRVPQVLANGTVRLTSITDTVNWNARSFYRGPGAWNTDISVFKNFQVTEKVRLRFTADFFNAFNHPLDAAPDATTGLQDLSRSVNEPRIIQFSLRLSF